MSSTGSSLDDAPVAIVTGGTRGIGRAVVDALLLRDYAVHLCSRSADTVRNVVGALSSDHGERVAGAAVDVGDAAAVDDFVRGILEERGRVDVLVNNAGLGYFAPVDEIEPADWRRVVAANLDGPFHFTRAVAPSMRERGRGTIVNVASLAGRNAIAGGALYNATKFGLVGFSEACMLDLRGDGVKVVCVLPGSVDTDFHEAAGRGVDERDFMLRPEDVARAVVDLLAYPDRALPSRIELRPTKTR